MKDFGAVVDGVTNDTVAVNNAISASETVTVDGDLLTISVPIASSINTTFLGNGSFTGEYKPYRKEVIPFLSSSDNLPSINIISSRHLQSLNKVTNPVCVLMGDSISTYFANSNARGDLLAEVLRKTLDEQSVRGITFYDRAIGGMGYTNAMLNQWSATIPWYAPYPTLTWIDMVQSLAPDFLMLSFGMNDADTIKTASLKTLIDYIQTWPKVPSIILATNLVPSPSSSFGSLSTQTSRDLAAGLTRSYAKFRGLGVLDIHRKDCMVRDGFDPCSSVIKRPGVVSIPVVDGSGQHCFTSIATYDWKIQVQFNPTIISSSIYLTLKTGAGTNDYIQIFAATPTTARVVMVAGNTDALVYNDSTFAYTWPTAVSSTSNQWFTFENIGGYLAIYTEIDPTSPYFGAYNEPYFFKKVVACGGAYLPTINANTTNLIYSATIFNADFKTNLPSITNYKLWGVDGIANTYGGSGFNHPGGFAATNIYRPLIQGTTWFASPDLPGALLTPPPIGSTTPAVGTFTTLSATTSFSTGGAISLKSGQFVGFAGASSGLISRNAGADISLFTASADRLYVSAAGVVRPGADNTQTLGSASFRWSTVYAGTGTINTSDEHTKQQIKSIDDAALRAWAKVEYCQFKFNDAVELKGDGARWHFGLIAQRVKDAFESEGLDAFEYGLLCYDEWEDQYTEELIDIDTEDESGVITKTKQVTGNIVLTMASGNRYGIRYEEALALECAYLRSKLGV